MRCPFCALDNDRVVDSRVAEDAVAIRRRRECLACGQRYTTYERIEDVGVSVLKRSGEREPFSREKVLRGLQAACKNRPVEESTLEALSAQVEAAVRAQGTEVSTEVVGLASLEALQGVDEVAYVRFASVYKGFEETADFTREIGMLVKTTAPKKRR